MGGFLALDVDHKRAELVIVGGYQETQRLLGSAGQDQHCGQDNTDAKDHFRFARGRSRLTPQQGAPCPTHQCPLRPSYPREGVARYRANQIAGGWRLLTGMCFPAGRGLRVTGISGGGPGCTASRCPCDPGNCLGGMIIGSPRSVKRKRGGQNAWPAHCERSEAIPQNGGGRFRMVDS